MQFKTAITGHTSGLGQAIYDTMDCIVFSKSTGYDIENSIDRLRIIEESKDCNVFINNAHSGFAQTLLLQDLFNHWKDEDKIIINIGSRASEFTYAIDWLYPAEKSALMSLTKNLTLMSSKCRITTLNFGYIGTKKIKEDGITDYIEIEDAVELVGTTIRLLLDKPKYRLPYMLYHA